jgi:hypothetical protein
MKRLLPLAALAALGMGASLAQADEVKGMIENIDLTQNTFMVGDKLFAASPMNTVGPKLEELEEGDEVTVHFENPGSSDNSNPINAMTISKDD